MNEFMNKHNFLKTFLILFLCLSLVSSITLYSNIKAQASEISEKLQKDTSKAITAIAAALIIAGGGAYSGVMYWGTHWGVDWTREGQVIAIISGMANMSFTLLAVAHGQMWVLITYGAQQAAIEATLNELYEPIIQPIFSGITKFSAGSFSFIMGQLKTVKESIAEIFVEESNKVSVNSGMVIGELNFGEMWLDFRNPEIIASNINYVTIDMQYNDYYGGSWLMHYRGTSELYGSFFVEELPERVMLKLIHLTSKLEGAFQDGYSPIDIYINGQLFLDDYDVASAHYGSHSFEADSWVLTDYLVEGENSITIRLVDIPNACSNYWIQALAILPESIPSSSARLNIAPSGSNPSTTIGSTWSVSGNVTDANGDNVSGASINVFLSGYSQSWGSGTTDGNGNYSINNIPAPSNDGSYIITIEASAGGTTGSNSSQTLNVTDPKEGHDLALGGFEVDPMAITPGGSLTLNALGITNKGENNEEFDLIFELKYPNGNLCSSKSKHLNLEMGHSLGPQSETLSSNSGVSGNYTAMVRIDCPYDIKPEDNESSLSVYVGQIQDYTQYKGDYVCCDIDNPTMTYGIYKLNVLFITDDYFRADVLVNDALLEPLVRFNPGEPHYYLGGNLLIFCNITDSSSQYACAFIGEPNEPNPFNYTPSTPHFSQGTTGILKVECPTGSEFRNFSDLDIILTDDVSTVRGWYDRETFINDWEVNRKFDIPASQATGTYTVWFSESLFGGDYVYLKKLDFVIEKGHDAFVNSISAKVDGVEKTEFDIGEDVTITANVGVSGGYTEEVNVVLSITGPNSYYYPDSKDRIESKATISSTSQDIAFDPWNTSGLIPGNYTISVTANMGADINSGNNTKTKAIVIKELPALIVNGQTDKATYDQGEQIKLTATVTDPDTSPVNDATVTATITWPDLTESNPALSYNAGSGKYEHIFNATQFGNYTIELRAVKTNYGTGTKELPAVTVNNTPPDTTINNVVPSEGQTIDSNSVIFSWTGSDSGTPVHHLAYSWKLNEGSYSVFSTNTIIELNELSDGPHTFYVKAFDGQLEDPTPAQRSFIVDTSEPPEIYLSKTANKTTVTSGEVVTYTIIYDNDGAGPAKNAVIEDIIPANTTYIGGSASSGNVIHTGNVVVEVKVNGIWEADSASPSGEVTAVRWTFDSDIAVDDGDSYGTVEDESPNTNDTDAGTITLQVTID